MLEEIGIVGAHSMQGHHHVAGLGGGVVGLGGVGVGGGGYVDNYIVSLPHTQQLGGKKDASGHDFES